jgi:phospholipase/lecithinase/hemolysin
MNYPVRILLAFFLLATAVAQPASAKNPPYSNFYVFGDSLSDTGNDLRLTTKLFQPLIASGILPKHFPAIPPSARPHKSYYRGRFSNGPVAVEYLWKTLGSRATPLKPSETVANPADEVAVNFAYGGSVSGLSNLTSGNFPVPGALGQAQALVAAFQAAGKPLPAQGLYFIWTGANDYLNGLNLNPESVVGNIVQAVDTLYAAGARNFIVPNLPDLGALPLIQTLPEGSGTALSQFTLAHNQGLALGLAGLELTHPGIQITQVDVYSLFNQVSATLDTGLGAAGACLFVDPNACGNIIPFQRSGELFWDVEHPTTEAHKLIAQRIASDLAAQ